jgi:hypothetical protein
MDKDNKNYEILACYEDLFKEPVKYIESDIICYYYIKAIPHYETLRNYFIFSFKEMTAEYMNERSIFINLIDLYDVLGDDNKKKFVDCVGVINVINYTDHINTINKIVEKSDIFELKLLKCFKVLDSSNPLNIYYLYTIKPSANYIKLLDMK